MTSTYCMGSSQVLWLHQIDHKNSLNSFGWKVFNEEEDLYKESSDWLLGPGGHVGEQLVPGDALVLIEGGGNRRIDAGQVQPLRGSTHPSHLKAVFLNRKSALRFLKTESMFNDIHVLYFVRLKRKNRLKRFITFVAQVI